MEVPKGILIPIGGNEDKGDDADVTSQYFQESGILRKVLNEINGVNSRIEVITTASSVPRSAANNYLRAFGRLGCKSVGVMHIRKRDQAQRDEYLKRLRECEGILFTGGDQLMIARIIGGTAFQQLMQERYMTDNFVIAGTSAGAMAMSTVMIYEGSPVHALLKDEIKFTPGLALTTAIIDTHFMHRGRFGRLAQAISRNPSSIGFGLGEDTGAIIRKGNEVEIIGSGLVIVVDGHGIQYSNIEEILHGHPISIENLVVHVMASGNCFHLRERKFSYAKEKADLSEFNK